MSLDTSNVLAISSILGSAVRTRRDMLFVRGLVAGALLPVEASQSAQLGTLRNTQDPVMELEAQALWLCVKSPEGLRAGWVSRADARRARSL